MTPVMVPVISPCAHPRCNDGYGNRRLTTINMCDPCRGRARRELHWLVLDYVTLKTLMPTPPRGGASAAHSAQTSFGHPAQWASDTCRDIAWLLCGIEDSLRLHLGERPAPDLTTTRGALLVGHAYTHLNARFERYATWPDVGAHVGAIADTHQAIRGVLGLNKITERLPVPCPSCDLAALVRGVGSITCGNCDRLVREQDYPMLTRIAIEWAIDAYEEQTAAELADTQAQCDVNA